MGIIVYVVLAVCSGYDREAPKWYEMSAYSNTEAAQKYIDENKKDNCTYEIREMKMDEEYKPAEVAQ